MVKISIIVPVYKVKKNYLDHCVLSLIEQTFKNIEILLVDDGSPDDCGRICDEYAQKDNRIKVIHKTNGGLVSARNAGYEVASGEWQMYLDGDDWIDLDCCEKLVEQTNKHPDVDVIFWKFIQELGNKSIKGKLEWPCPEPTHLYEGENCKDLARHTLIYKSGVATAYCKLIRTDFARKYNLKHDERLRQGSEGLEFSFRVFHYANKALFVNQYFNHYRFNADSISKTVNEKNTQYLTDCFRVIENDVKVLANNAEDYLQALYQRIAYMLMAIAMGTYFHPTNTESLRVRIRKFKQVIDSYDLYKKSVQKAPTTGMDKLRKIAFMFIRLKMFFMLEFIAQTKQFMLKRGKFNY